MSAADCIRHLRERARTYPGAEGRLALMKMARELEEMHEVIATASGPGEYYVEPKPATLHVREWAVTSEPRYRGPSGEWLGSPEGDIKEFRIHDAVVLSPPKWLAGMWRNHTIRRSLVFTLAPEPGK